MQYAKGINPKMLLWFRERAGYSLKIAAKKIQVSEESLLSWESGQTLPTISQAMKIGDVYKQPWAAFFLKEKPIFTVLKDFRSLDVGDRGVYSPELNFYIQEIEKKQKWTREYLIEDGNKTNKFVGSWKSLDEIEGLAQKIITELGLDFSIIFGKRKRSDVLKYYISLAEDLGIYICKTTGQKIFVEEMRGIYFNDKFSPFICINSRDAISAQIFTLAHELAHLWIGSEGVSNVNFGLLQNFNNTKDDKLEMFCNRVASEIVLPQRIFLEKYDKASAGLKGINELSELFKISEEAIAYKLYCLGKIDKAVYEDVRQKTKDGVEVLNKIKSKFGNYHSNKFNRNGKNFTNTVVSAYHSGKLLTLETAHLLGVKVNHIKTQEGYARSF